MYYEYCVVIKVATVEHKHSTVDLRGSTSGASEQRPERSVILAQIDNGRNLGRAAG